MVCNADYRIISFCLCGIYDEQIYKGIIKGGCFMNKIITVNRELFNLKVSFRHHLYLFNF